MPGKHGASYALGLFAALAACVDKPVEAPGTELVIDARSNGSKGVFAPSLTLDPVTGRV